MKTAIKKQMSLLTALVAAGVLGTATPAMAGKVNMAKEGKFDFNFCMAGESTYHALKDSLGMAEFHLDAAMHSNIPNGPFDLQGSHCVGHGWTIDGKWGDAGYCKQVDADGDLWMFRSETGADFTGKWEAVGGTGKYEGMKGSGQYQPVGFPPAVVAGHFNRCNRNTGTYKLK